MTIARNEYIQMLCDVTNSIELPAFVKADVVERLLSELRRLAVSELESDTREYEAQIMREKNDANPTEETRNTDIPE